MNKNNNDKMMSEPNVNDLSRNAFENLPGVEISTHLSLADLDEHGDYDWIMESAYIDEFLQNYGIPDVNIIDNLVNSSHDVTASELNEMAFSALPVEYMKNVVPNTINSGNGSQMNMIQNLDTKLTQTNCNQISNFNANGNLNMKNEIQRNTVLPGCESNYKNLQSIFDESQIPLESKWSQDQENYASNIEKVNYMTPKLSHISSAPNENILHVIQDNFQKQDNFRMLLELAAEIDATYSEDYNHIQPQQEQVTQKLPLHQQLLLIQQQLLQDSDIKIGNQENQQSTTKSSSIGRRRSENTPANRSLLSTCVVCGRSFGERSKLKRHMRVHSGELPYVCPIENCKRRFSQDFNLQTHLKTHTGERPFECEFPNCGRRFSQKSNMISHTITIHKGWKSSVVKRLQ